MVDVAAIRRQALNKYGAIVTALLRGEDPFPLPLRYGRVKPSWPRADLVRSIEHLKGEAADRRGGAGLTIEWTRVDTVRYGSNDLPGDICLATADAYFGYVGKQAEFERVTACAKILSARFPALRTWLPEHWAKLPLAPTPTGYWESVCRVVEYLRDHAFPDVYARELPIEVPTKFVEENQDTILLLVAAVAPGSIREAETFGERLGLRSPDSLVECRLLDPALMPVWPFRQFTVGISDLERLQAIGARVALITENRTNFLSLPQLPGAIAIAGQGRAVTRLRRAPFLGDRRILYWGDIDTHGFEILAILRRIFPQVRSVMMDEATFARFTTYHVAGAASRSNPAQYAAALTPAENELFVSLSKSGRRLEQERIPNAYAASQLIAAAQAAA